MLTYLGILLNARLARMDQRGASAVEYGLMIAGIALVCVPVTIACFKVLKVVFEAENSKVEGPPPGAN